MVLLAVRRSARAHPAGTLRIPPRQTSIRQGRRYTRRSCIPISPPTTWREYVIRGHQTAARRTLPGTIDAANNYRRPSLCGPLSTGAWLSASRDIHLPPKPELSFVHFPLEAQSTAYKTRQHAGFQQKVFDLGLGHRRFVGRVVDLLAGRERNALVFVIQHAVKVAQRRQHYEVTA